jgi:hypothetical protein
MTTKEQLLKRTKYIDKFLYIVVVIFLTVSILFFSSALVYTIILAFTTYGFWTGTITIIGTLIVLSIIGLLFYKMHIEDKINKIK